MAMPSDARPEVNPAALGLASFGLTTLLLSMVNAGLLPLGGENVVIPLAIAFGGSMQLVAGVLEVRSGNTFGMTAFLSYGAFWWWFALLLLLGHNGLLDLKEAGSTIGVTLLLWGGFTFMLWISTFRLPKLLWLIFLTLWIAFFLLGGGIVLAAPTLTRSGGWMGLLCGSLAMYGSFAIVTNATFGRTVIPMGAR